MENKLLKPSECMYVGDYGFHGLQPTHLKPEHKGFPHSQRLLLAQETVHLKMQTTTVLLLILGVGKND